MYAFHVIQYIPMLELEGMAPFQKARFPPMSKQYIEESSKTWNCVNLILSSSPSNSSSSQIWVMSFLLPFFFFLYIRILNDFTSYFFLLNLSPFTSCTVEHIISPTKRLMFYIHWLKQVCFDQQCRGFFWGVLWSPSHADLLMLSGWMYYNFVWSSLSPISSGGQSIPYDFHALPDRTFHRFKASKSCRSRFQNY